MPITSTFYDTAPGKGIEETIWARSARSRGCIYGVTGENDLNLTNHPTKPYTVNIGPSAGFWGHGVWDESTTTVEVACTAPAAGTSRYDLIAARRDWQPVEGGPTTITAVRGTATRQIPTGAAGRQNRPGVLDDQPIWLLKWTAGVTTPTEVIDLRCWPGFGGAVEVADRMARDYLTAPGAELFLNGVKHRYVRIRSTGSTWGWVEYESTDPVRSGFRVVKTNKDGYCTVPYDTPMPSGTKTAVGGSMNPPQGMSLIRFVSGEKNAANFFVAATNGQGLGNIDVAITYIATGF